MLIWLSATSSYRTWCSLATGRRSCANCLVPVMADGHSPTTGTASPGMTVRYEQGDGISLFRLYAAKRNWRPWDSLIVTCPRLTVPYSQDGRSSPSLRPQLLSRPKSTSLDYSSTGAISTISGTFVLRWPKQRHRVNLVSVTSVLNAVHLLKRPLWASGAIHAHRECEEI